MTYCKEYIERNAILELYQLDDPVLNKNGHVPLPVIRQNIMDIPAADVAPVRHGRWEEMHYEGGILDGTNFDRCSVCGYERVFDDPAFKTVFKYCPNCGAMMDGGSE